MNATTHAGIIASDEVREERARRRRFGQHLGRYRLGPLLGAGGSASVYLARLEGPHAFGRLVALKVVHEHLLMDREFVTMFLDEANLSARLAHPGIAHTYELGEADGVPFIAMEYLSGQPFSRIYRRAAELGRPLSHGLVAWIGASAARALHHAHELRDADGLPLRIVHRDVSPENVFATRDGQVKLLDFGIATAERRHSLTKLGEIKGKFRYMSPEYTLGEHFDRRLDAFALGATLYEIALGQPAFDGADATAVAEQALTGSLRDPRELRPDFPEALERCLRRALAPDPSERFETLEAFAVELEAIASASPVEPRAELRALLDALFVHEFAAETASIAELCALPHGRDEETTTSHAMASDVSPQRRARVVWFAAAAGVALVGLTVFLSGATKPTLETSPITSDANVMRVPTSPAAPSEVRSEVAPSPSPASALPATGAPPSSGPAASSSPSKIDEAMRPRKSPATSARRKAAPTASGLITNYPFP